MKTARKLVVSDVDGTLVRGSLVLNHAVNLHREGHIDLGELPDQWEADKKNEVLISALADAYRTAITGKSLKDLDVPNFVRGLIADDKNFYSALNRLVELHKDGADVILISGSPNYLVNRFGKSFGFKSVASKYHRDRTQRLNGKVTGMFTAGAKQAYIDALDVSEYDEIYAFGDTASDAPLFSVAHHSVLVDPSKETFKNFGKTVQEVILD